MNISIEWRLSNLCGGKTIAGVKFDSLLGYVICPSTACPFCGASEPAYACMDAQAPPVVRKNTDCVNCEFVQDVYLDTLRLPDSWCLKNGILQA